MHRFKQTFLICVILLLNFNLLTYLSSLSFLNTIEKNFEEIAHCDRVHVACRTCLELYVGTLPSLPSHCTTTIVVYRYNHENLPRAPITGEVIRKKTHFVHGGGFHHICVLNNGLHRSLFKPRIENAAEVDYSSFFIRGLVTVPLHRTRPFNVIFLNPLWTLTGISVVILPRTLTKRRGVILFKIWRS